MRIIEEGPLFTGQDQTAIKTYRAYHDLDENGQKRYLTLTHGAHGYKASKLQTYSNAVEKHNMDLGKIAKLDPHVAGRVVAIVYNMFMQNQSDTGPEYELSWDCSRINHACAKCSAYLES